MNQRGIWQLILMAREGDRQAISELFYASFRPAYLVLLTFTEDKNAALDILSEGYVDVFENLESIETAEAFMFRLIEFTLRRAKDMFPSRSALTLPAGSKTSAQAFRDHPPEPHDFNTIKSLDLSSFADRIMEKFTVLPVPDQICAYLYNYADLTPGMIAGLLSCGEDAVASSLQSTFDTVLPQVDEILQENEAFRGTDALSAVLWALRNTARYSLLPARLDGYYQMLLEKMVTSGILDTTITEDDLPAESDIPIKDMQPMKENVLLKRIFSLQTLIIFLVILALIAGAAGFKQLRAYHARRSQWNDFTERTTLSMTNSAMQLEHYIFSTEYERPTETEVPTTTEPATTEMEATTEAERVTEPTSPVITTEKPASDFAYTQNENRLTITGYNGTKQAPEVPASIDGKPVVAIGENAFFNSSITSITLPSSIKIIGKNAFHSCASLQSITIPNGVTGIESNAFRGCTNLRSVTLPNTLKTLGAQAFYRCTSLTSLTLPESLQSVGDWAFAYCTNLTGMSIPANVYALGSSAFYECKSLSRCAFSSQSKLTSLGDSCFFDCTSLSGVTLPSGVKTVPANCFIGCRSLSSISLPASMTTIGANAFKDCISLSSVKLPSKLTRIDQSAFQGCTSLKTLTIPNGTTTIGETAFRDCTNLQSVTIPSTVKNIGSNAFLGCDALVITCPENSTAEKYAIDNRIEIYGRTTETTTNSDDSSSE